jgi:Fungal specific transcription factor domain
VHLSSDASGGTPPCERCKKEGRECVLGGSNRGGSRIRKKNANLSVHTNNSSPTTASLNPISEENEQKQFSLPQPFPSSAPFSSSLLSLHDGRGGAITAAAAAENVELVDADDDDTASTADSAIIAPTIPRNPSDAWQLLKDVANRESEQMNSAGGPHQQLDPRDNGTRIEPRGSINGLHAGISTYRLVREGYLTADIIHMLVGRYAECYHPYLPLVPRKYFDSAQIDAFAVNDKHLLTAVLTIASKDLVEQPHVHLCCSRYMHDLISGIAAGHDCEVEAVEALLLLAEWEPQGLRDRIEAVGRGEEDRSAWMHVGIALRTGYFLGLDRTAFRQESVEEARVDARKRLAWANCYVSDRLISVRIGRAFWSRGPGPMTGLSRQDFPSLHPSNPGDEDYAKIFQAILDLTQLYSNVHDVLYSGMRTSGQMVMMGDYVKYVDEFRMALARWNHRWANVECSAHIKATLRLSYEYLCLYTNAFVFQAAISQALATKPEGQGDAHSLREHLRQSFSNIGAMPDARFIWASVAAAKGFLTLLITVDPVRHLRYMPLRFYLYSIYSAVFLYKARSYGVIAHPEEQQVRQLIHQTVDLLRRASVSMQDPGSRYARLLELLWMKKGVATLAPPATQSPHGSDAQLSTGSISLDAGGYMQYSPANNFSWLDLEAVGDYVSGDLMNPNPHLLIPPAGFQAQQNFVPQTQGMQWQPNPLHVWQFDLQGNLLF